MYRCVLYRLSIEYIVNSVVIVLYGSGTCCENCNKLRCIALCIEEFLLTTVVY